MKPTWWRRGQPDPLFDESSASALAERIRFAFLVRPLSQFWFYPHGHHLKLLCMFFFCFFSLSLLYHLIWLCPFTSHLKYKWITLQEFHGSAALWIEASQTAHPVGYHSNTLILRISGSHTFGLDKWKNGDKNVLRESCLLWFLLNPVTFKHHCFKCCDELTKTNWSYVVVVIMIFWLQL